MSSQRSLFDAEADTGTLDAHDLGLDGGDAVYFPRFFSQDESDRLLADLDETTVWRHETIKMYGKVVPIPRLSAWHGDLGRAYTYSNISMQPQPWTVTLTEIKARVEVKAETEFNSVLLNLYRHGQDSVAWHSDDEEELGEEPVIASVSLGATRRFQLRRRDRRDDRRELELGHGSLLLMRGSTQRNWEHQVPKTAKSVDPRINLTYRRVS
jgi:alkylated DNA repair dioxygenase AlkB